MKWKTIYAIVAFLIGMYLGLSKPEMTVSQGVGILLVFASIFFLFGDEYFIPKR